MSNRILLDVGGLKVSRAGIDVLTAAESDLIFNSNASQVGLFTRGTFSVGNDSSHTVNYGRTFNNTPLVVLRDTRAATGGIVYLGSAFETGSSDGVTGFIIFSMKSSTTGFSVYNGGGSTYEYAVWDFDL